MRPDWAESVDSLISGYLESEAKHWQNPSRPRFCLDLVPIHNEWDMHPDHYEFQYMGETEARALIEAVLTNEISFEFGYHGQYVGYEAFKDFAPDEAWLREWMPKIDAKCDEADFCISSIYLDSPEFHRSPSLWWEHGPKFHQAFQGVIRVMTNAIQEEVQKAKKS